MSKHMSPMNDADPTVPDLAELREAAARHAQEARRRSEAAAARQSQLAQARAGLGRGAHDVSRVAPRAPRSKPWPGLPRRMGAVPRYTSRLRAFTSAPRSWPRSMGTVIGPPATGR
jgi:hypothetical protein